MGSISDDEVAQVQGCLRSIFRPEQSEQSQHNASPSRDTAYPETSQSSAGTSGTKIKLSLKPAKSSTSMFPDLPVNDSEYEKRLLQRVLKSAIASMRENDPQVRMVS